MVIVTSDGRVAAWARRHGWETLAEAKEGRTGLDRAAAAATAHAAGSPWAVIHADLPLATAADLGAVFAMLGEGAVLAPSRDGGTNVAGGTVDHFPFHYGSGSFQHHLAGAARLGLAPRVLIRPRLALDLDGPADLADALAAPGGGWLRSMLPASVLGGC